MKIFVNKAADISCGETYRAQELHFCFKQNDYQLMVAHEWDCKCDFQHILVQFTHLNELTELIKNLKDAEKYWEKTIKIKEEEK